MKTIFLATSFFSLISFAQETVKINGTDEKIHSWKEAMKATDKSTVKAIEYVFYENGSPATLPAELTSFPNLAYLDLSPSDRVTDFSLLTKLTSLTDLIFQTQTPILPAEIWQMTWVKNLKLTGSSLDDKCTTIEGIQALTGLEELDVKFNDIAEIPAGFRKLEKLRVLNLEYNQKITDINELSYLPVLEELIIQNTGVSEIPESFTNLKSLKVFRAEGSLSLKGLANLKNCTALEELSCSAYYLSEFPAELLSLPLKNLAFSSSQITDYSFLAQFEMLEYLSITYSNLHTVPKEISSLKNLKSLYLYKNTGLTDISSLQDLPNLESLYLWGCNLATIPASIGTLTNLKEVHLGRNENLAGISNLGQCTNLEFVDLDGCLLVPKKEIAVLKKLTGCYVAMSYDDSYKYRTSAK